MLKYILPVISFGMTVSCSNTGRDNAYSIAFGNENVDSTLSRYVESIDFIPLADTTEKAVFREIDKIIVSNGLIYIGDFSRNRIIAFDMCGNFAFAVDAKGRGADEYMELKNFTVDDTCIYTIDNYRHEICTFDARNGSFVTRTHIDFVAWDIERLGPEHFIFAFSPFKNGQTDIKQPRYRILITDNRFEIERTLMPYSADEYDAVGKKTYFTRSDANVIYNFCCDDSYTVFSPNDIAGHTEVRIDFRKKTIPEKYRMDIDLINDGQYRYLSGTPIVCGKYTALDICTGEYSECYLYADGKMHANTETGSFNYLLWPCGSYGGKFISHLSDIGIYEELASDGFARADAATERHLQRGGSVLLLYNMQ